ncbi:MAG: enoyl-CoA hydratase-related protein [Geminicoccaceae bacterium]
MTFETIGLSIDERGVARLTLNRPDKRNALSAVMIDEIVEASARIGRDPEIRCVILEARGKVFCAGGDLEWMMQQIEADRSTRMREARRLAMMLQALDMIPKPLVGRIHGDAFGGGIGLLAVCDHAVAADHCRFGLTETRLGLIPATISPYVIGRTGAGAARRVFMSAALFDAREAERLDLVGTVVAAGDLDCAVDEAVSPYLSVASGAVARARNSPRHWPRSMTRSSTGLSSALPMHGKARKRAKALPPSSNAARRAGLQTGTEATGAAHPQTTIKQGEDVT